MIITEILEILYDKTGQTGPVLLSVACVLPLQIFMRRRIQIVQQICRIKIKRPYIKYFKCQIIEGRFAVIE